MTQTEPTQIGPYRIVRRIGEGGMGVVYEAINEQIERRVAIKCLNGDYTSDAEAMTRFFNEARAANRINHPGIVQVSDSGSTEAGRPFIVMELLEGQTLADRIQAGRGLALRQILPLGWQIADALAAAHEKQIVHRDLKPENVMLIPDPVAPGRERVKLLDFGIAKLARSSAARTSASVIMGTPRYMAPEQCRGAGAVDDRADVYSLGVMLFELVAGRLPFVGEGAGELIAQHLYKEPPALRPLAGEAPDSLVILIESLLRKSPAERPSMRAVSQELEALASELGALGGNPSRALPIVHQDLAEPTRGRATSTMRGELDTPNRSGLLMGAMAIVGVSVLLGVVITFRRLYHSPSPTPAAMSPAASATVPSLAGDPSPPTTALRRMITWRIETTPAGASVLQPDGKSLGVTPLVLSMVPLRGTVELLLRLPGHREQRVTLDGQHSAQVRESLQPLPKRTGKGKPPPRGADPRPSAKATSYED